MKKIDGKKEVASTKAQEGQEIFNKSCIGCHAVGSNDSRPPSARIAPNLANFADRDMVAGIAENNEENLKMAERSRKYEARKQNDWQIWQLNG